MGRLYTVEFENVAVTAAQDLFEIVPAANKPISIHGIILSQHSDVGDAAEELLRLRFIRGHTTSGSGGSAPTPVKLNPVDAAAGFTAEINNTTIASTGTALNILSYSFNIRTGLELWFPPECRILCSALSGDERLVARLLAAPTDSLSMSGTLFVEEIN